MSVAMRPVRGSRHHRLRAPVSPLLTGCIQSNSPARECKETHSFVVDSK